ncbi:MAG: potassium-transporting ATPase subunit KdpA [Bdellovibrionales bacterium]|nr:potassium-transporting ATPase subunit KdpA [Bdellovibrionales bacterium]
MKFTDVTQIIFYSVTLIALTPPLGVYMYKVFEGQKTFLTPVLGWLETLTYRIAGVNENEDMNWRDYVKALLWFNFFGFLAVFLLQMFQQTLPVNPQSLSNVTWHSSFNTAVSFMTNTNWQGYGGEVTMSYLTQMLGLGVQNFVSAATGAAVFLALARGILRKSGSTIGNFWIDLTRTTVYVLLPLSFVLSLVLISQGVVQSFGSYAEVATLEGTKQTIPLGPAASQIAIKQLGTNGGGFFSANSAVPMENPTPFSNFLQMLAILLIPAALTYTYGRMVKSQRQGWTLFAVMFFVWFGGLALSMYSEYITNPVFQQSGIMEGKETRFGVVNSLIWSTATTSASNGSVNAMHSSLSPIAGGVALFNIMLGEVIFGGVGAGMYGMLLFVLLTVFLSGLMVGRSPEYLGKKIEAPEVKMALLGILAPCAVILLGSSLSAVIPAGLSSLANKGPHGLSEILYAFTSAAGNNGSAFAGLNANTPYYNVMLALAMLIGRFVVIIPALAIAGQLVKKKSSPLTAGTFATDTPIFGVLLVGVIVIVGALTFLPALSLGPIVEHFLMLKGQTF